MTRTVYAPDAWPKLVPYVQDHRDVVSTRIWTWRTYWLEMFELRRQLKQSAPALFVALCDRLDVAPESFLIREDVEAAAGAPALRKVG